MTQRITVSLPDDLAEHVGRQTNVSAYVAAAIRDRMAREQTRQLLVEHGFPPVTDEGVARARQRRLAAAAKMTPERYAQLRALGRDT